MNDILVSILILTALVIVLTTIEILEIKKLDKKLDELSDALQNLKYL